jgi:hypothetical protein
MAYETVASIINDAMILLGLRQDVTEPFLSSDTNVQQLLTILKAAGRDLLREHPWSQLQVEYTFSTTDGEDTYDMPAGFDRYVDQTQWNRSTSLPLTGPLSPQGWQLAKVMAGTTSTAPYFRTQGTSLVLYPVPTSTQTLALEYLSRYWVQSSGAPAPDKDKPTADDDVVWLDGQMMVHRIRRDWQEARGLDSAAASNAYESALASAKGIGATSSVKSLNGTVGRGLLTVTLPPTGWGS